MWYMTEERKMLQKTMEQFVNDEVRPFIPKMEEEGAHPKEIISKLGQLGILGLTTEPEYGGMGTDWISYGVALEEISKASNTLGLLTALASDWIPAALAADCSPEQVEKYIKPAIRGEILLGGYCTEPCGLFNFAEYKTTAVADGDDFILNGMKILGTNNGVADAFFVVCKTSDFDPATWKGVTMFIMPADTPGIKFGKNENKIGWHGSHSGTLYLDNVRLPKSAMVGAYDMAAALRYFTAQVEGLCSYGIMSLGSAEAVWQKTRKFLGERMQHGVSLWDAHQVIRTDMAELWMEIENYRYAVYGVLEDRQRTGGAYSEEVYNKSIALKGAGAHLLEKVASACITMHGGIGTVKETEIERYYRDAPMSTVGCGSIKILADQLADRL